MAGRTHVLVMITLRMNADGTSTPVGPSRTVKLDTHKAHESRDEGNLATIGHLYKEVMKDAAADFEQP